VREVSSQIDGSCADGESVTVTVSGAPYRPLSTSTVRGAGGQRPLVNTFDVFDTLIARRCIEPARVFDIIEERSGVAGFARARREAERKVASAGPYRMPEIYAQLATILSLPDERLDELRRLEVEVEVEQVIPIAEHLSEVTHGDLLLSDMYLDQELIRQLLHRAGLTKEVGLVVTTAGKQSGRLWSELSGRVEIRTHLGDNPRSDGTMPRRAGIATRATTAHAPTVIEQVLIDVGLRSVAELCREVRLRTWTSDPVERTLQEIQASLNLPILTLASVALVRVMDRLGLTVALFSSRDCLGWMSIFDMVAEQAASPARARYFYTSRLARVSASADYLDYVRHELSEDAIVVDLCGTGWSLSQMAQQLEVSNLPVFLMHQLPPNAPYERIAPTVATCSVHNLVPPEALWRDANVALEMANYAEHPMVTDVRMIAGQSAPILAAESRSADVLEAVRRQNSVLQLGAELMANHDLRALFTLADDELRLLTTKLYEVLSGQPELSAVYQQSHDHEGAIVGRMLKRSR